MALRTIWMTLIVEAASAATVFAQPWVPPQGEGTISLTYQNYYVVGHYDVAGRPNINGATHARALIAEVDFGLTDNFGLTVTLPFIGTKYTGPDEYIVGGVTTHPGLQDDRKYHSTFQDVRIEGRRLWWAGPVAIAPLVAVILPTHDYETHGEAVAGRHRRELQAGAAAGADLNRILPRTYAYGRYSLNTAEHLHGFSSLTSTIYTEGGVDLSSWVGVMAIASWQLKHRGPTIPELAHDDWLGHDRFIVSSYCNLGGGVTFAMTRNTELHVQWVATASGQGGAHRARMLSVGTTWSFGSSMGGFGEPSPVTKERFR